MNTLVAYYSLTGTTEQAVEELTSYLNSKGHATTVEKIIPKSEYSTLKAYTIGCMQALGKRTVELNAFQNIVEDFDMLVVIGPTWAWTCSPPVYSFVSNLSGAREKQKAITISTYQSSAGNGPKALAGVLAGKGFEIMGSLGINELGKMKEIFEKELRL
ncbi:MAG: hypothetical protein ABIG39_04380 [Candidatus Micrarchaeota archaeon]